MKMYYFSFCLLFCSNCFSQITKYNTKYHFSVEVPNEFESFSADRVKDIENSRKQITGGKVNFNFVLVFSKKNQDYPNIQMVFISNPNIRDISFFSFIKTLTKARQTYETINIYKEVLPMMKISDLTTTTFVIDEKKQFFVYGIRLKTEDNEELINIAGGFVLANGQLSINFVCKQSELYKNSSLITNLFRSVIIEKEFLHKN